MGSWSSIPKSNSSICFPLWNPFMWLQLIHILRSPTCFDSSKFHRWHFSFPSYMWVKVFEHSFFIFAQCAFLWREGNSLAGDILLKEKYIKYVLFRSYRCNGNMICYSTWFHLNDERPFISFHFSFGCHCYRKSLLQLCQQSASSHFISWSVLSLPWFTNIR